MTKLAPLATLFFVAAACAPALEPSVIVLSEDDLVGVSVEPDAIIAPSAADWVATVASGDILASGVGRGFLRKVTSIELGASTANIATVQASLEDALLDENFQISEADKAAGIEDVGFGLADIATVLYDDGTAKLEISDGHILFRPSVDLDLDLSTSGIDFMELSVSGDVDIRTVLKASVDGSMSKTLAVNVWKNEWHFVQLVGVVPVVEVVRASLDAELDISVPLSASLEVGATVRGTVRGGLRYADGEFTPFSDQPDFRFDPIDPVFAGEAGIVITGRLKPKLEVSLYELAAISIDVTGEVRFQGDLIDRSCELSSGVSGNIGASLGALNFKKKFSKNLFRLDRELGCTL